MLAYPPGLEFIAAFFGVLYAGCVAVPTYPPRRRTLDRFAAIARDAGARVALGTASSIAQYKAMPGQVAAIRWLATDELADADADRWIEHDPPAASLAMIQYTSGSTRQPKGVVLSHANLVANARAISEAFEIRSDSASVFWLPTYHDMGLIGGVLVPVFAGMHTITMAPATFLQNPFLWLDAISKSRATISGGPNFAYDLCVRKIDAQQRATLDLSSWSLAFSGAETVRPDTLARFAEAFAPCGFRPEAFYPCYGLAEATLMVTGRGPGPAPRCTRSATTPSRQTASSRWPTTPRTPTASSAAARPSARSPFRSSTPRRWRRPRRTGSARSGSPAIPSARATGAIRKRPRRGSSPTAATPARAPICAPATSASSTKTSSTSPAGPTT